MGSVKAVPRNYLIVSALLPIVLLWNPPPGPKTTVCTKPECNTRGSLYHKNMNDEENPCIDFYKFACGGWSKHNPRPTYLLEWSVHTLMQREALGQLQTILRKPAAPNEPPYLQRAKRVFNVCMKIPSLGRGDADFVAKNMDTVGHYPQTSLWDLHNGYVKLTGESPIFDIQIMANMRHNDDPLLQFKDKKSPYGSFVFLTQWNVNQKTTYHTFLVNLVKSVRKRKNPQLKEIVIGKLVEDVLKLRHKLNQISRMNLIEQSDPMAPLTVRELQQWYNRYTHQKKSAEIDWGAVVQNFYSGVTDAALLKNPTIGFRRKSYFMALAELFAETPEETLANHFDIYFMERHMTLTAPTLELLDDLVSSMNGFSGYVRNDELEKSLKCVEDMNMDDIQGKLYVDNNFKKENVPVVANMLEEIKAAIEKDIQDSKWADRETKGESIGRVREVKWWIGYPPWYDNPLVKAESNMMRPATVNAYLIAKAKRICINAAVMKSPLFDQNLPDVINYGALGSTLGHELYHSLDEYARFKDEKGVAKKCFIQQYTKLATEELKSMHLTTVTPGVLAHTPDTSRTYMEDQADVMGLQTAFHAYQAKLKKQKDACAVLPNFERYNCEQMFFISFANSMCAYQVPQIAYSTRRTHNPFRLRVNAAVSNNKDFGRVFGCDKKDPMDPEEKCNLWK